MIALGIFLNDLLAYLHDDMWFELLTWFNWWLTSSFEFFYTHLAHLGACHWWGAWRKLTWTKWDLDDWTSMLMTRGWLFTMVPWGPKNYLLSFPLNGRKIRQKTDFFCFVSKWRKLIGKPLVRFSRLCVTWRRSLPCASNGYFQFGSLDVGPSHISVRVRLQASVLMGW